MQFCLSIIDGTYFRQHCYKPGYVHYADVPWYQPESGLFWTSVGEVRVSQRRTSLLILRNSLPPGFWEVARARRQGMPAELQYYLMESKELMEALAKHNSRERNRYLQLCRPQFDFIEENQKCLDLGPKFQVRRTLQLLNEQEVKPFDDDNPTAS